MKKLCLAVMVLAAASAVFAASMEMTSARLYKKQGEFEKSLQYYDAELSKNPGNGEALYERGELLGEIAMSPGRAELAKTLSSGAANPQRNLLERMIADFDKAKAGADPKTQKKLNKEIGDIISANWNTFYVDAVHEDSAKNYDKAIEQTDMAILLMPNDWRAFGLKAQILDRLNKPMEALKEWETAHRNIRSSNWEKEKPKEYAQAMDIIQSRLLEGYYSEGERLIGLESQATDTTGLKARSDSLNAMAADAFQKTIEFADGMLKTAPDNGDATQFKAFALAQLASNSRFTDKQRDSLRAVAVSFLNEARKKRPDYPPIVYTVGQFNLQLGDTAAAIKAFDDYSKMEGVEPRDRRDAEFVVGVIYLEGGSFVNTENARDLFKTMTEQDPNDKAAWTNYGVALIRLGDSAGGKAAIDKAKSLPGN